jgi:hypothetical protein
MDFHENLARIKAQGLALGKKLTTDALSTPMFTAGEVREILNVPLPRFQAWLGRGIFDFTELPQGERRIIRLFSGFALMTMLIASKLMEDHGLEPTVAADLASHAIWDIELDTMSLDMGKGSAGATGRHDFYAIAKGESFPLYGSDTIEETASRVKVKADSFIVLDLAPMKKIALEAMVKKLQDLIK